MKKGKAICTILLITGLSLLVLGLMSCIRGRRLMNDLLTVEATVIQNMPHVLSEGNTRYISLMEYHIGNEVKTYSANYTDQKSSYHIGEKVMLAYHREGKQDVHIHSFEDRYLASSVLFALALPMLLIGSAYFLFRAGMI